jgi:hypothetical protein
VNGVTVTLTGINQTELTSSTGFYATGTALAGTYDATYSKVGYYPQTVTVTLVNGQITQQDIQLVPIPPFTLTITVLEDGTNNPIDGVEIRLEGSLADFTGVTNGIGEETMTLYYEELYGAHFGKWGYVTHCETLDIDASTGSITIYLSPGYYDDFAFDFGWNTLGTASQGQFERAIPYGTESSPGVDSDSDCSDYCYITENLESANIYLGTVQGGDVMLQSPLMDLTGYSDPYVHYERWFFSDYGPPSPGDSLEVYMSNGSSTVKIDVQTKDTATFGQWITKDIRISDFIGVTSTMQLFFRTSDELATPNVTEAAVDNFYIVERTFVGLETNESSRLELYPNPSNGIIHVRKLNYTAPFEVRSYDGTLITRGLIEPNGSIDGHEWSAGVYFIKVGDELQKIVIAR